MSDLFASNAAAAAPESYDASAIEVLEGLEPALVRGVLLRIRPAGAEDEAEHLRRDADAHPDQDEQDDGEIGGQVQGLSMSLRASSFV